MSNIDDLKAEILVAMNAMSKALVGCARANFCAEAFSGIQEMFTKTMTALQESEGVRCQARVLYAKQEKRIIDLNHSLIQREAQIQALTNQSDDWVVLPRKATPTMLAEFINLSTSSSSERYQGLLDAAPKLEGIKAERPEPMAYLVWCHAGYGPDNYYDAIEVGSKDDLNCDGSPAWPVWSYPPISIPLGWKLVPKKITEEMRHAFNKAFDEHEEGILDVIFPDHGWDAMLEVSPTADVLIVEDVK